MVATHLARVDAAPPCRETQQRVSEESGLAEVIARLRELLLRLPTTNHVKPGLCWQRAAFLHAALGFGLLCACVNFINTTLQSL